MLVNVLSKLTEVISFNLRETFYQFFLPNTKDIALICMKLPLII